MLRRSSNEDANAVAFADLGEPIRRSEERDAPKTNGNGHAKNAAAVALGRLGGKKGGKARADALTPERRREIAQEAAKKRWAKRESVK